MVQRTYRMVLVVNGFVFFVGFLFCCFFVAIGDLSRCGGYIWHCKIAVSCASLIFERKSPDPVSS